MAQIIGRLSPPRHSPTPITPQKSASIRQSIWARSYVDANSPMRSSTDSRYAVGNWEIWPPGWVPHRSATKGSLASVSIARRRGRSLPSARSALCRVVAGTNTAEQTRLLAQIDTAEQVVRRFSRPIEETGRGNSIDLLRLNSLSQVSSIFAFRLRNSAFAVPVGTVSASFLPDSNA